MSNATLERVPVNQIDESKVALRQVDREHPDYLQLRDSIEAEGVTNPIVVRPTNPEYEGELAGRYVIIDGLHRFNASKDLGLEDIPANVLDDVDAKRHISLQIQGNFQRIKTKPFQYAQGITAILAVDDSPTISELAKELHVPEKFINERLGLTKLDPELGRLVDENAISVANAKFLAKVPLDKQMDYATNAQTMKHSEFAPMIKEVIKAENDARRKGRESTPPVFGGATAKLRPISELKEEIEVRAAAPDMINAAGITDPVDAFEAGIKWAIHLDPQSEQEQLASWTQKQDEREANKKRIAAERAAKKQKDAEEATKAAAEAAEAAAAVT